jgi:hypothetical protein
MPATLEATPSAINTFAPPLAEHPSARALLNHRAQSSTTINGWPAVIFGVPFMGIGGFIFWMMTFHPYPAVHSATHRAASHAPDWIAQIIVGIFFLPGAFVFSHGIAGLIRKAAYNRDAAARPNEPWLYDYHWRREGIAFSAFDDMLKRLFIAVVWTAFLAPFAWVGMTQRGARPFLIAVAVFGLLGLFLWFRWAQMLVDYLRYGNSYLAYEDFPFPLGGTLRARLRVPRHVSDIDELRLTFRCVQEQYVTTGRGENRTTNVVCYELYGESVTLGRDRLNGLITGEIPIEFKIPSGQPATTLIATPPTYWEVEAKGKSHSVNYESVFLVPVYKM